jgi:hypothetical protein
MTKKDYAIITNTLLRFHNSSIAQRKTIDDEYPFLVDLFSVTLKRENARFDDHKFREACGL